MKIRLGELRRVIHEAMGADDDLAAAVMISTGGGVVVVYKPDVLVSAIRDGSFPASAMVGYVRLINMTKYCGAWELSEMWGPGYGDMLTDIAFAISPSGRLVPDRMEVSTPAEKKWIRISQRGDVTLEDLPPKCKSGHDDRPHLKKIYSSTGDPVRLEAMKSRHQEIMDELSAELSISQEKLENIIIDAGASRFSGSVLQ